MFVLFFFKKKLERDGEIVGFFTKAIEKSSG